jgi:folate-binding Fe-S cluster repair protein YgfZ
MEDLHEYEITDPRAGLVRVEEPFFIFRTETSKGTLQLKIKRQVLQSLIDVLKEYPVRNKKP